MEPKSTDQLRLSIPGLRSRPKQVSLLLQGIRAAAAPALWLGLLALCGGMAVGAYLWLAALPPLPECRKITPLASDSERLYCAERVAQSGKVEDILAGFALVKNWSNNHPLHNRVNRAMREWSKGLLAIAQTKAEKGDLEGAISLARKVPINSPARKEAQTKIAGWQKNRALGTSIKKAFQTALAKADWQTAEDKIAAFSRLGNDDKWRSQVKQLRQQLGKERRAHQQLEQLEQMTAADPSNAQTLAQAIAQANQIDPNSYVHREAKVAATRWSQSLLQQVMQQAAAGDVTGAIATAQALPFEVSPPTEMSDLVWLSRAKTLATSRLPAATLSTQLRQVWLALDQMRQVKTNSAFHAQAQAIIPPLQKQLQDLNQLEAASSAASLGQIPSLQLAIQMAQTITPNRPQRLHAQSLIARWNQDIQKVLDRPNLQAAQKLAAAKTIPQLRAAIAQATVIAPGRALRPEAQTAIAQWNRQIQAIEDRPVLNQATNLASQKKLKQAIQQAEKIRPNRALYADAQTSIKKWNRLIQLAADQPILSRAKSLADKGNLPEAINVATQIASGRALYEEAQSSISRWNNQIEAASRRTRRYPFRRDRGNDYAPPTYADAPPAYDAPPTYASRPSRRASAPSAYPFPELPPP